MFDFDGLLKRIQNYKILYIVAQSDKVDENKQAKTTLIYDALIKEFEECVKACESWKNIHRESGIRLMQEKVEKKL